MAKCQTGVEVLAERWGDEDHFAVIEFREFLFCSR
jgi:hypothetical protein